MEIDRTGFTYTVDTLNALKSLYGSDATLYFIIGADVIPELVTWKDYKKVFGLCEFIALLRPGFDKKPFLDEIDVLKTQYHAVINVAESPLIDISSTAVRERIREQRSVRYLVPECVEEYIYKHELYRRVFV